MGKFVCVCSCVCACKVLEASRGVARCPVCALTNTLKQSVSHIYVDGLSVLISPSVDLLLCVNITFPVTHVTSRDPSGRGVFVCKVDKRELELVRCGRRTLSNHVGFMIGSNLLLQLSDDTLEIQPFVSRQSVATQI